MADIDLFESVMLVVRKSQIPNLATITTHFEKDIVELLDAGNCLIVTSASPEGKVFVGAKRPIINRYHVFEMLNGVKDANVVNAQNPTGDIVIYELTRASGTAERVYL